MVLENWTDACRKMKLGQLFIPHSRINLKWIKDVSVRPKTIKFLEENRGSKIWDIAHRNLLLDIPPEVREKKEKINTWDFIRVKHFCTAKEIIKKTKRQLTEWENIFADTPDEGLISKTEKVLTKLNTKKNPIQRTWIKFTHMWNLTNKLNWQAKQRRLRWRADGS